MVVLFGLLFLIPAVLTAVTSIFRGGFDDSVDTRPKSQQPNPVVKPKL